MKKLLMLVLTISLIAGLTSVFELPVIAAGYGANGNKFLAPIGLPVAGSIPISSREELEAIKDDLNGNYHLVSNIDLSGAEWAPISNFKGQFDGQGYVITNLTIQQPGNAGLFGSINGATVKNVGLEGTSINGRFSTAGAVVGNNTKGCISNCYNTGNVSNICVLPSYSGSAGSSSAGGICGSSSGTISNCYNKGNIFSSATATDDSESSFTSDASAGGICADFSGSTNNVVSGCFNTGNVTAFVFAQKNKYSGRVTSSSYAGGISAYTSGSLNGGTAIIKECFNTENVSASSTAYAATSFTNPNAYSRGYTGGICGYNTSYVAINDCYNTGDITNTTDCNGSYTANNSNYTGGICGYSRIGESYPGFSRTTSIRRCYNAGNVTAAYTGTASATYNNIGAIIGGDSGSGNSYSVDDCYWVTGSAPNSSGYSARTVEQMKLKSSFYGFDFGTVWTFISGANHDYPVLQVFALPEILNVIPNSESSTVTVDINCLRKDSAILIAAVYNDKGKLLCVVQKTITQNGETVINDIAIPEDERTTVKVMMWSSFADMQPLCEAKTKIRIGNNWSDIL